jgi:hypothetical protein
MVRLGGETRAERERGFDRAGCPIFFGEYEAVDHLHLLDWVGRQPVGRGRRQAADLRRQSTMRGGGVLGLPN